MVAVSGHDGDSTVYSHQPNVVFLGTVNGENWIVLFRLAICCVIAIYRLGMKWSLCFHFKLAVK